MRSCRPASAKVAWLDSIARGLCAMDAPYVVDEGTVLPGGFVVNETLGAGSLASVHAVTGPGGQSLAVKMLHEHLSSDQHCLDRFAAETDLLASIQHPTVIAYRSRGVWERRPFLVMDRARGQGLDSVLSRDVPIDALRALAIIAGVIDGLGALHAQGVVHRDIKPSNMFVDEHHNGAHVQLIDLGSAVRVTSPMFQARFDADQLTPMGRVMITPQYASRESLTGVWVRDPRGDLYAAAVVLFQMLTGHLPFEHADVGELVRKIVTTPAPPLSVFGTYDAEISAFVARALHVDADRRFPDAQTMGEALRHCVAQVRLGRVTRIGGEPR